MLSGDHFYPGVQLATWNVTEGKLHHIYFSVNFLKLLRTPIVLVRNCDQ